MNLLITGAMGQLGYELQVLAAQYPQHHFVFTDIQGTNETSSTIYALDITDKAALAQMVAQHNIEVIINCAAFTNVDAAETQEERADLLTTRLWTIWHKSLNNLGRGCCIFPRTMCLVLNLTTLRAEKTKRARQLASMAAQNFRANKTIMGVGLSAHHCAHRLVV